MLRSMLPSSSLLPLILAPAVVVMALSLLVDFVRDDQVEVPVAFPPPLKEVIVDGKIGTQQTEYAQEEEAEVPTETGGSADSVKEPERTPDEEQAVVESEPVSIEDNPLSVELHDIPYVDIADDGLPRITRPFGMTEADGTYAEYIVAWEVLHGAYADSTGFWDCFETEDGGATCVNQDGVDLPHQH